MATMTSMTVTTPVAGGSTAATVSTSQSRSVTMSSVADFGGMRLRKTAPISRSAQTFSVRAGKSNVVESLKSQVIKIADGIKKAFGSAEAKASDASSQAQKELDKAASQAKSSSGDLEKDASKLKGEAQSEADAAGKKLDEGIEDLKTKLEDVK